MKQIIISETDKMIEAFMKDFFLPYLEKNFHHEEKGNDDVANIIMSFAQSMMVTLIHPILISLPTDKQRLRHARETVQVISDHLFKINKLETNKMKIN